VKLIDVYPEKMEEDWKLSGFELMIAEEIFRGRYRNSFEKPEAIASESGDAVYRGHAQLESRVQKGHRIMVQVQSTWFRCTTGIRKNLCRTFLKRKMPNCQKPRRRFIVRRNIRRALRWMCCYRRGQSGNYFLRM